MKKICIVILIFSWTFSSAQLCVPNTSALVFDGTTTYVDQSTNTNLSVTGPLTVEAWVNATAWGFNSAQGSIVCKHGWTNGEGGYVLRAGGLGELSFNIAGLDPNSIPVSWVEVISPINSLQLNTWYHVAGTFDGHVLTCYVNGVSVATTTFEGTIVPSNTYSLKIGKIADNQSPGRYWDGMIDEVRIWNRALTPIELQASMNRHLDPISSLGLLSYWRLNENTGTTTSDLGTGGNTGTIIGATWTTTVPFNNVPSVPTITPSGQDLFSSSNSGNQWYVDGNPIGGATASLWTPVQIGSYTVMVTSTDGCTATSSAYLVTSVGVETVKNENVFEMWPNPAQDEISLRLPSAAGHPEIEITDLTGRIIYSGVLMPDDTRTVKIDARKFSKGTYSVKIISNQKFSIQKLIIE